VALGPVVRDLARQRRATAAAPTGRKMALGRARPVSNVGGFADAIALNLSLTGLSIVRIKKLGTRPEDASVDLDTAPAGGDAADAALAAAGDTRAFERLYRNHAGRVHGLARRMAGFEHADELTQEVFVRAWQKLGTFRGESAFGTWLHRVAINVILGRRSVFKRERDRYQDPETAFETLAAPSGSRDTRMDFESAIEKLPPARRIFVLHDVEGYKHEEIAGLLGITAGTSKAQPITAPAWC
jgi:RNA polymerase sigma-70 factor (ECF subfamily)